MLEPDPAFDAESRTSKKSRPGTAPPLPGAATLRGHIAAMWAQGMSTTGIRRALGLSERDAVGHGIIPGKAWTARARNRHGTTDQGPGIEPEPGIEPGAGAVQRSAAELDKAGTANGSPAALRIPTSGIPTSKIPGTLRMIDVVDAVAAETDQSRAALLGTGQGRRLAGFRQLAMYLLRQCCAGASLPTIGFILGRDHTTVLYGIRRAEARLACDPEFRALHDRIRRSLLAEKEDGFDGQAPG